MNAAVQPKGPASGYDTDSKAQYRKDVWASFPQHAIDACINDADTYALLLPAKQGQEIQTAMDRGVPEHKIICVDENPALIAVSEWRKTHPTCKFYGCYLSDVADKLTRDGRKIGVANFDLCNNFGEELIAESSAFFSMPRYDGACVAITIAKGRETNGTNILLDIILGRSNLPIPDKRAAALVSTLFHNPFMDKGGWVIYNQGSYRTNKVPMTYIVLGRLPIAYFEEKFVEIRDHAKKLDQAHRNLQRDLVLEQRERFEDVVNGWRGCVSDEWWVKFDAHLDVLGPLLAEVSALWECVDEKFHHNKQFKLLYPDSLWVIFNRGLPFSPEITEFNRLTDYLSRKRVLQKYMGSGWDKPNLMSWSLYYSYEKLGIE